MRLLAVCVLLAAAVPGQAGEPAAKARLHELRGKPAIVNFWATWCVPCQAEMPALVELEKTYGAKVQFVAASLDDKKTRDKVPEFLEKYHATFPVWYGITADDLDDLKLGEAVPATLFLDGDGRTVFRILGQARSEEVEARLKWLAGDRAVPKPEPLVKHLEK